MNMKITLNRLLVFMLLFLAINSNSQTFNLVWSDEFNGTGAPDPAKWGYELGYIRNNELQYYTNSTSNSRQYNGNLEITVREETVQGNNYGTPATFNYTSGSVITLRKIDWVYGKIEGRFKMPKGKGLWACFWTLGANYEQVWWPQCGEIDIFEHINNENLIHTTAHWADASNKHVSQGKDSPAIDVTQWHTYSIVWTPNSIKWFVDDDVIHELNILDGINSTQEFHKPHYILINLPIGGSWPGPPDASTVLPATMYCDYVKVYELVPEGSQTGNQFINCGGSGVGSFAADKWYSNGATYSYNNAVNFSGVPNAAPGAVYQSNRSGNLTYTISGLKPDSLYTTHLHFAENSKSNAGARLFNVKINGKQVLTDFDIFVAAGNAANKAVVKNFNATADSSGKIAIQFISVTDKAQINGIGIFANSVNQIAISKITLPAAVNLSTFGEVFTLTAVISPDNATNQNLVWSSSSSAVATVSQTGVVTAVSNGTATITASSTDGSYKSATSTINVNVKILVTAIAIPATATLPTIGATTILTAIVAPGDATIKTLAWSSSNAAVATVSANGVVTAVSNGKATITATSTDGSNKSDNCIVTITARILVTSVTLPGTDTLTAIGDTTILTAIIAPANATNQALTWSSSNPVTATVSDKGVITAVSNGTTTITATTQDGSNKTGTCEIKVSTVVSANNSIPFGLSSISIYPNPAKEKVFIDFNGFNENEPVDIRILDITGKLIFYKEYINENPITIKFDKLLKDGIYFIRVQNDKNMITQKLIINEN
jgi:uncharacterized protein YjdB/beta-glucanase (GH16 family)